MRFLRNIIIVIAFLYFCPLLIFLMAQTQSTSLFIKVTNQLDELVTDAEVELIGQDRKKAKTNEHGAVRFSNLTEGNYQIIIATSGFKKYKSGHLAVKVGESQTINITLEIALLESKVEVDETNEANTDNYGSTRMLSEEEIKKLPENPVALRRALQNLINSVTGEDVPVTVDGLPASSELPPKHLISQIRLNQNIFSAQFEGQGGGGIEIFTKTDVEKFSGSIGFGADSVLRASNPFIGQRIPSQIRGYSFSLSGPLIKKKAMFSLYLVHRDEHSGVPINATVLNSALQPVSLQQSFSNSSGYNSIQSHIKIDLPKKQNMVLKYIFSDAKDKGQGVGNLSLPENAYNSNSQTHTLQFAHNYFVSENFINQTRFHFNHIKEKNFGGNNEIAVNVMDAFQGGGSQIDSLNRNSNFELSNDITWQKEKYGLGVGFKIRGQTISQFSRTNFGGKYTFSGKIAPVLDFQDNPLIGSDGIPLTTQISGLESYRRTQVFRQFGYTAEKIRKLGGGSSQLFIAGGNPNINVNQYDIGLYLQNSYKVNRAVALSFGVRYENQTNIKDNLNFAPRFGVVLSPQIGKKKHPIASLPRISVGIGAFYSRFGINNILNIKQTNNSDRSEYLITNTDILDFFPNTLSIDTFQKFALQKNRRFIETGFQSPVQTLFNIGISKKIFSNFSVNFNYSRIKNTRQTLTRNINAPFSGTFNLINLNDLVYPFGKESGFIYQTSSQGKGNANRFMVSFSIPPKEYLQASFIYTFIKEKNNLVSGSGSSFNPYDFSKEFGFSHRDGQHSITFSSTIYLPLGFNIYNTFKVISGERFNIFTGRDTNRDGFFTERPAFASDLSKPNLIKTKYGIFDPEPSLTDVIIPRNLGKGSPVINLDTSIEKSFKIRVNKQNNKPSRYSINLNITISNILNINNKGNPIGNMSSPNFLNSVSVFSNEFSERRIDFSLGFGF